MSSGSISDTFTIGQGLSVFMGFFAIMNPIANTPIFLGLTSGEDAALRRTVAFLFFVSGERLIRFVGQSGLNVVTHIMRLILAVIGVQMLINGIQGAFQLVGGQ